MSEKSGSIRVGCFAMFGGMFFGLMAGVVGALWWGWKGGLTAGMVVAGAGLLISFHSFSTVKELSWGVVCLPALAGVLYLISPFDIPGPVDDAAVLGAGGILSLGLASVKALRVQPGVVLPFIAAGIYTLMPNFPGPVDELIVWVIGGGFGVVKIYRDGFFLPVPIQASLPSRDSNQEEIDSIEAEYEVLADDR